MYTPREKLFPDLVEPRKTINEILDNINPDNPFLVYAADEGTVAVSINWNLSPFLFGVVRSFEPLVDRSIMRYVSYPKRPVELTEYFGHSIDKPLLSEIEHKLMTSEHERKRRGEKGILDYLKVDFGVSVEREKVLIRLRELSLKRNNPTYSKARISEELRKYVNNGFI